MRADRVGHLRHWDDLQLPTKSISNGVFTTPVTVVGG
jgi:hypothetical protein